MRNLSAGLTCFVGSTMFLVAVVLADTPKLSEAEQARTEYLQKALKGEASPVPGRRMIGSGTGFFVAPQRVLTAQHVIERCAVVTIRGGDGKTVMAERVANSIGLATALNPLLGYLISTAVAKEAQASGRSVKDIVLERGYLTAEQLTQALQPERLANLR